MDEKRIRGLSRERRGNVNGGGGTPVNRECGLGLTANCDYKVD